MPDNVTPYRSASIAKLTAAVTEFAKQVGPIRKGADNPFFHSRYADLASIIEATSDVLAEHGLAVLTIPEIFDQGQGVRVTLSHITGEWIEGRMLLTPAKDRDPQSVGSAITYARRYIISMVLNLATEDDDGEKASGRGKQPAKKAHTAYHDQKIAHEVGQQFDKEAEAKKAATDEELKERICKMLLETEGGKEYAINKLEELSAWVDKQGKTVPGKRSTDAFSSAQLKVVYGKVKAYHTSFTAALPPLEEPTEEDLAAENANAAPSADAPVF